MKNMMKATPAKASRKDPISEEDPINGVQHISTWVCKNLACKTVLSSEDSFCKKCSCSICHMFDNNKDASLWLVCASEHDEANCCGSSFHIECLLKHNRVGCFHIQNIIHLDGSVSCAACGKISGILDYLKKQLVIAKDARRMNILCHRIFLIYRLLEGSNRFKELYKIIEEAKEKLESEVGPLDGISAKMAHGIVMRSSTGIEVQKLCTTVIQKADEWWSSSDQHFQDSLTAACTFKFADVTSSSLTIILKESLPSDTVKGYKLWYWKSKEQPTTENPVVVPKDERQILVYNLSSCTEYSFRAISFTDDGILGHSETRCYTRSKEIYFKPATPNTVARGSQVQQRDKNGPKESNGFKILNILETYQKKRAEEGRENMHEGHGNGCEHDSDASAMCREKQISITRQLCEDYEHVIKVLRQLECDGHVESEFRKKFMTWYSLRSTEQECRVVSTFIKTFGEDRSGLAGQLIDAFGEIITCNKTKTHFCDKLWHWDNYFRQHSACTEIILFSP